MSHKLSISLRALAIACALCLCASCLAACGSSHKQNDQIPPVNSDQALADMYATWWLGSAAGGNIAPTRSGNYNANDGNMPWEAATMMSDIYTQWLKDGRPDSGDEVDRFIAQWNWTVKHLGGRMTKYCGLDWPNPAVDDTGWNATYFMMAYMVTKSDTILSTVETQLTNGFNAFKAAPDGAADDTQDRSGANGLWYSQHPPSLGYTTLGGNPNDNRTKSLYAAALVSAAFEFLLVKKQTDPYWQTTYASLWSDALGAYNWMEANLLRASADTVNAAGDTGSASTLPQTFVGGLQDGSDYTIPASLADNLYWCDYNVNRTGKDPTWGFLPKEKNGPSGGSSTGGVAVEGHSNSFLGGTMAMAVCHARLYQLTGDVKYRNRAVRTAQAFTNSPDFNKNGILLNDRDAWANGFFAGMYVDEVLTLPGIRPADINLIISTGAAAYDNCRITLTADQNIAFASDPWYTGKVFYRAEWDGGNAWTKDASSATQPTQIMTSGTTVNMIMAAGFAQNLIK